MYQFYLLSVVTNILAGAALSLEGMDEKLRISAVLNRELLEKTGFRIGLGVVTFIVGIFKFLTVAPTDVPVVGDILPALSGLVLGFILLLQYYRSTSDVSSALMDKLDAVFTKNSAVYGTIGMGIGALHFLLPRVLFL